MPAEPELGRTPTWVSTTRMAGSAEAPAPVAGMTRTEVKPSSAPKSVVITVEAEASVPTSMWKGTARGRRTCPAGARVSTSQ